MTKKERTGRQIIRETLRITWLAQAGAYTLMQRLNELPQDKTINIMLSHKSRNKKSALQK